MIGGIKIFIIEPHHKQAIRKFKTRIYDSYEIDQYSDITENPNCGLFIIIHGTHKEMDEYVTKDHARAMQDLLRRGDLEDVPCLAVAFTKSTVFALLLDRSERQYASSQLF